MDIVTLALAKANTKKYVDEIIDDFGKGIVYKGAVSYYNDLPNNATQGDCYSVLYKGTSGTDPFGAEYVWGKANNISQWIKLGEDIDLTNYIKNTDYATSSKSGVFKINNAVQLGSDGTIRCGEYTYDNYLTKANVVFVSKGTLENVIAGKNLTTKTYVDNLIGDIGTVLDAIQGEEI